MYVAYNVQIIQDPATYGTNFLYKKADVVFFVGAALYLAAAAAALPPCAAQDSAVRPLRLRPDTRAPRALPRTHHDGARAAGKDGLHCHRCAGRRHVRMWRAHGTG